MNYKSSATCNPESHEPETMQDLILGIFRTQKLKLEKNQPDEGQSSFTSPEPAITKV